MPQPTNTELLYHMLKSIIEVIGRRSSERYAVVMINNVLEEVQKEFDFLQTITVASQQYVETEDSVQVDEKLNDISDDTLSKGLKLFLSQLVLSAGKTAGYYFIKELKESMSTRHVQGLEKKGIDLDFLQLRQAAKKEEPKQEEFTISTVIKHLINSVFLVLNAETSRENTVVLLTDTLDDLSETYPFLEYITIHDIRFTQSDESIWIAPDMSTVNERKIGEALQAFLIKINGSETLRISHFKDKLQGHLQRRDKYYLENIGVDFSVLDISNTAIFKQVMTAILDVLGKASTPSYAILFVDTVLKKVDDKFDFLSYVKIDSTRYSEGNDAITVMTNFDDLSSIETGRAIQKIMEEIVKTLGGDARDSFVEEFKHSISKKLLKQMEDEMGVNFHIVKLREQLTGRR